MKYDPEFESQGNMQCRTISADFTRVKGPCTRQANLCVGSGRAALGLRRIWQEHLALAHRECGFTYVRFHAMFHDEMGVVRRKPDRTLSFDWHYLDLLYDGILAAGMRPFVELSFMPAEMASGDQTIFWWKGNVTPPRDMGEWKLLVTECARHLMERYGRDEVAKWYFEVWNEPNLKAFWSGTKEQYFQLYDVTAQAVKGVCPAFRVGGPATAGNEWIEDMVNHCAEGRMPLDFIATHDYGVDGVGLDESGTLQTKLFADRAFVGENMKAIGGRVAASAFPHAEVHYTEWSASWSPRDPIHDSYFSAAYILDNVRRAAGAVTSQSYWTFTDIFEESGPPPSPFHGGFGLINREGLRKPAFFAHKFLNELGREELFNDDPCSWVCRDEGSLTALLWDYSQPVSEESNQHIFIRDMPAGDKGTVQLNIRGLPEGKYRLNVYRVGHRSNDVYSAYRDIGAPPNLTAAQVAALGRACSGSPEHASEVVIGTDRTWTHRLPMRENDVCFLALAPVRKNIHR